MDTLGLQILDAINEAILKDGGHKLRTLIASRKLATPKQGGAYRAHLGASVIGKECGRSIWYGFRWATKGRVDPRITRLFYRGNREELVFYALLEMIGCTVYGDDGEGAQFSFEGPSGHDGGSLDGVVTGLPIPQPELPTLLECKTHGDTSFQGLAKGVREAKWEHFVQMQVYMHNKQLTRGLYCAVNKNDDHLYFEIISYDKKVAEYYTARSHTIIFAQEAPPRLNNASVKWFACRFCDHKSVCLGPEPAAKNCRTCTYFVLAQTKGEASCGLHDKKLTSALQVAGCADYAFDARAFKANP
jgi:hypothetical protein